MKTIKTRLLPLLLALAMCLTLLPTAALADEGDFVIENGVLTKYTGSGSNVVVPSGVTAIGEAAFYNDLRYLKNVTIPDGISETTFSPDDVCNRGEIVTFLYRAYH